MLIPSKREQANRVPFSSEDFARGFIASLITRGRTVIVPQDQNDRRGFYRAYLAVRRKLELFRDNETLPSPVLQELTRVRNALRPSNSGAFDGFEQLLRGQQLSMTASPNPYYEEIALTASRPYAESLLSEYAKEFRSFIDVAADAFLQGEEKSVVS